MVYSAANVALWERAVGKIPPPPPPCSDRLLPGEELLPGQSRCSNDGRFKLILQGDSNLVLYSTSKALWASNTVGRNVARAVMQGDGNLVLYTSAWAPVWSSVTERNPGAWLAVQSDGNVVIYTPSIKALWATNTVQ